MELKSLKDIPTSFALAKKAIILCFVVAFLAIGASIGWSYFVVNNFSETAYILTDNGKLALAQRLNLEELKTYRKPEIKNHIKMFHELFWNIDQFNFEDQLERSFHLIGNSGKDLFLTLKAQGHFTTIVNQNLVQKIEADSIFIDMNSKPMKAMYYGKLQIERTDQANHKMDNFLASFELLEVARTDNNPHGLLIENYNIRTTTLKEK